VRGGGRAKAGRGVAARRLFWDVLVVVPESAFVAVYLVTCAFLLQVMRKSLISSLELVVVGGAAAFVLFVWLIIVAVEDIWSDFAVGVQVELAALYMLAGGGLVFGVVSALQAIAPISLSAADRGLSPQSVRRRRGLDLAPADVSPIRTRLLALAGGLLVLIATRAGWAIALAAGATRIERDGAPLVGTRHGISDSVFFSLTELLPALVFLLVMGARPAQALAGAADPADRSRDHLHSAIAANTHYSTFLAQMQQTPGAYGSGHAIIGSPGPADSASIAISDAGSTGSAGAAAGVWGDFRAHHHSTHPRDARKKKKKRDRRDRGAAEDDEPSGQGAWDTTRVGGRSAEDRGEEEGGVEDDSARSWDPSLGVSMPAQPPQQLVP
jgi:hypothetical protein